MSCDVHHYITYQGVTQDVAEQKILQDLKHLFQKSHSSFEKFGFPTPSGVPTELEEAISVWMQPDVLTRQGHLLDSLNTTHPNNDEQQMAFECIMNSIIEFKDSNCNDINENVFHYRRSRWDRKIGTFWKFACCMPQ